MARQAYRVVGVVAGAAAMLLAACSREEKPVDTSMYVAPAAEAPAPVKVPIPTWPADTPGHALDRPFGVTPAQRGRIPSCSAETPLVTTEGIGPIFPGQSLNDLLAACPANYTAWHWDDGRYGPAVAVRLGRALVVADVNGVREGDMVTRVVAFDNAKTAEGIGPGSSLAAVYRAYGAPTWQRSQCSVDARFESTPNLVIRIALPEEGSDAWTCDAIRKLGTGKDFSHFPRDSRVSWIATELGAP